MSFPHDLETSTVEPRKPSRVNQRDRAVALTIAWHSDVRRIGEVARLASRAQPFVAELSRIEPAFCRVDTARATPAPLGEPCLSRKPVTIELTPDSIVHVSCESTSTTVVVDGQPVRGRREIPLEDVDAGVVIELADRVVLVLHRVGNGADHDDKLGLIGDSDAIVRVRQEVRRVADAGVPVLIRGETGAGKELVARAIHGASPRANKPCVCINMATLERGTAGSELFGHARGAFTGAVREHRGFFDEADGGTLFLDEIGETPVDVQAMLLRVLETGEVTPVGGQTSHKVDVRLLSATDAALEDEVTAGTFREPLFHRLAGYQIAIPPLRERRDDIGRLLCRFVREELATVGELDRLAPRSPEELPWMPARVVGDLIRFRWPGNVRQLHNVARQLVVSSRGAPQVDLGPGLAFIRDGLALAQPAPASVVELAARAEPVATSKRASELTEDDVIEALRANAWRTSAAASALGISRTTLYAVIDRSPRIRKARDLTEEQIEQSRQEHGGDLDAVAAHLEVSKRGLLLRMRELELDV